jgi:heme/copper-type cytochrome/quinol oxidase subunit 2
MSICPTCSGINDWEAFIADQIYNHWIILLFILTIILFIIIFFMAYSAIKKRRKRNDNKGNKSGL